MLPKDELEMLFWDYLDDRCEAEARAQVETLLKTDTKSLVLFQELKTLHQLAAETELEQPSIRFQQNVMDTIAAAQPAKPLRSYYNPWVTRGIAAALFVMLLLAGVRLFEAPSANTTPEISLPSLSLSGFIPGNLIPYLLFALVLAGLLFIDTLAGSRRNKTGFR